MSRNSFDEAVSRFRAIVGSVDKVFFAPVATQEFDRPEAEGRRLGAYVLPDTLRRYHKGLYTRLMGRRTSDHRDLDANLGSLMASMAWYYTQPVALFSDELALFVDSTADDSVFAAETFSRLTVTPLVVSLPSEKLNPHAQYGAPMGALVWVEKRGVMGGAQAPTLLVAVEILFPEGSVSRRFPVSCLDQEGGLSFDRLLQVLINSWQGEWGLDTVIVALKRALFAVCDMPQAIEWQKTITMPKPVKTRRKGLRYFPPDKPRQIVFEMPKAPPQTRVAGDGDGKGTVRPHVRRAHWHRFRVGPRDAAKPTYKTLWIPPIIVHATEYKHE